jgi:FtsP/CotA-like multicopper oxidase with cupredoxin domain
MNRRSFLLSAASGVMAHPLLNSLLPASSGALLAQQTPTKSASSKSPLKPADHSLTIKPCTIEISPGVNIKTIAYNGQVPGPLLRLRQGVPVTIDVANQTENAEIVFTGMALQPTH